MKSMLSICFFGFASVRTISEEAFAVAHRLSSEPVRALTATQCKSYYFVSPNERGYILVVSNERPTWESVWPIGPLVGKFGP